MLLPIIGVIVCLLFMFRCFSGSNLLWMGWLFKGNGRAVEQIPVWFARVRREDDGTEVMVRIKGRYATGNFAADDLVSLWGTWSDGVLTAKRGFNHRTRSRISFEYSVWPVLLLVTLAMIVGMAIYLCLVAAHSGHQVRP